ncbi:MAG: efflux RND transporter periplasmic adaptor subunit [Candidatus Eisenbacteria bacterium]|nr:efflux RND transporter periplasmic adaptor subunit [Candidatus Eisenbacteria bacterium]
MRAPHSSTGRRPISPPALLVPALLIAIAGCSQPAPEPQAERPTPVEVWITAADTLRDEALLTGVLEAYRAVDLVAEVSGPIERLRADIGDEVREGQILAAIEKEVARENLRSAEAGLMAAEARHAVAREDFERDSTLLASGDVAMAAYEASRMSWQSAAADLKSARAALALARRQLTKTDLRAPFAGSISRRHCEIGTYVTPGMPLFRIVDIDSLRLWLGIAQRDLARVRVGQEVTVTSEAFPDRRFRGRVRSIAPEADEVSRTFPAEVVLPNPPEVQLRDGMVVAAALLLAEHPDVIALPHETILRHRGQDVVFVVRDSVAQRRPITAGAMIRDRNVVRSGLRTGEAVVVSGMQNLRDGMRVAVSAAPQGDGADAAATLTSPPEEVR